MIVLLNFSPFTVPEIVYTPFDIWDISTLLTDFFSILINLAERSKTCRPSTISEKFKKSLVGFGKIFNFGTFASDVANNGVVNVILLQPDSLQLALI